MTTTTTTGGVTPPGSRQPLTGEHFRRERESSIKRSMPRRSMLFFLGLTVVWIGVLWTIIFGSRPHIYLLLGFGIYLAGVLTGAGISLALRVRDSEPAEQAQPDAPVDADVRTLSSSTATGSNNVL